jgi:hypothetical protein
MTSLGWKSLGVLELAALPSIGEARWVPWVREADVLLVKGCVLPPQKGHVTDVSLEAPSPEVGPVKQPDKPILLTLCD